MRQTTRGLVLVAALMSACAQAPPQSAPTRSPRRIVSMAPALTETAFALGLGDRVVGVTRYCEWPPEARSLPKVGGFLDPSWEALVALRPDLVLLMQDHNAVRARLDTLGIRSLQVDQGDLDGILTSFVTIARACGVTERGEGLASEVRARLDVVASATADLASPRVLVVVEREVGAGPVRSVWVAGPGTFYDDLVGLAGGANAWHGTAAVLYPEVSREGLIALDPDVILDVEAELQKHGLNRERVRAEWDGLTELRAVRDGRVAVLDQDYMVVPGPRIARAVEAMARAIHPQAVFPR